MLPGNRLLLTVHVRGEVDDQRLDIVENARRSPLSSHTDVWEPQLVEPNSLLFVRRATNPGLWVASFDGGALDLTSASMVQAGATGFDAARDGTLLVSFRQKERRELVWVRPAGKTTTVPGPAVEMTDSSFGLAPGGGRAVLSVMGPEFREEVLVRDLATGTDTRVPPPRPLSPWAGASVSWAPGGRLFFSVGSVDASELYDWPADGSAGGRKLLAGRDARMAAGRQEIYFTRDEKGAWRLRRARLLADGAAVPAEPVFQGNQEPLVRWFDVSPDGQLLAFTETNAGTGQTNVIVTTLPDLRERHHVTSNGGTRPKFSRDGKALFYFSGGRTAGMTRGQLNAVPISTDPLTIGGPSVVLSEDPANKISFTSFDLAADGRLLMSRRAEPLPGDEARLVLVQNWMAATKK
jgi:hypothetical protein